MRIIKIFQVEILEYVMAKISRAALRVYNSRAKHTIFLAKGLFDKLRRFVTLSLFVE